MTWNFSFVAADQLINNAAKIRQMSGGQFTLPVVFRGPGGSAHMLAAQHSQSTEALWAHIPGLKVVMPANPKDAKGLLKSAIRDDNPIVFIEGEVLYADQGEIPDGEYTIPLGVAEVKRAGQGHHHHRLVEDGEDRARPRPSSWPPRASRPRSSTRARSARSTKSCSSQSVKKTGRCLIIEEGWPFNGVGAEIAYRIGRRCFDDLDAPVERLTGADMPMPYNHHLEQQCIPDVPRAVAAAKKLLYLE